MKTPLHPLAALLVIAPASLIGQTTWDFGATPDLNWSNFDNWDTAVSPAGTAVIFGASGTTANATTIGNVVDSSVTVNSLTYNHTGSNWQVTQIASDQTLTVDATVAPTTSLLVGGNASALVTQVAITGAGSFVVNEPAGDITISNTGGNASRSTLNMAGLSTFTATVNAVNIGTGTRGNGTLLLADNNTITASSLTTGGGTSSVTSSLVTGNITFGLTNVLNIDTIKIGTGFTSARAQFRTGAPTSTLTIRAQDGINAADLSIGELGAFTMDGTHSTIVDLSGGQKVDAKINNLVIGSTNGTSLRTNYNASLLVGGDETTFEAGAITLGQVVGGNATANIGTMTGNLTVSAGTLTADSVTLASSGTTSVRNATGNLTVSGGSVGIAGDVTTGIRSGGTGTLAATVTISGGSLTIGGDLANGEVTGGSGTMTSTVNLSGGVLDMTGGAIAVDSFNFTGGALRNVGAFTGDLNAQNSASIGFDDIDVSFAGTTLIGGLTLGLGADLELSLAEGFTPGSTLILIANDGVDSISGTFATINGGAFGPGNSFSLVNNTGTYNFVLNYAGGDGNDLTASLGMVPEPSTAGLLAGLAAVGFAALRRRPVRT